MLIDWFTVGAQAVNFLILAWLLKRFLYKPVLAAIDAREKKVAAQLSDAASREEQARTEREDFRHQSEALEQQRDGLLRKATDEANAERQRLLDGARKDADTLRSKLADVVTNEREELNRQIITRTRQEVFATVRKTLTDLAGTSLEDRMTEVFIRRLQEMPAEQRTELAAGARTPAGSTQPAPALVRSAFELPPAGRTAIEASLAACLGADGKVSFETCPDLISGIELVVNGQKVAWSVADYLASLARSVATLLEPKAGAALVPAADVRHAIQ